MTMAAATGTTSIQKRFWNWDTRIRFKRCHDNHQHSRTAVDNVQYLPAETHTQVSTSQLANSLLNEPVQYNPYIPLYNWTATSGLEINLSDFSCETASNYNIYPRVRKFGWYTAV